MIDNKKVWDFVVESYIPLSLQDDFKSVWYKIINYPKPVVWYVNLWFYFEFLYKFLKGKVSLEKFVYLWDVVNSWKRINILEYKKLVLEWSFVVWKDIIMKRFDKYKWKYLILSKDSYKLFASKLDFSLLKDKLLKIDAEILLI